MHVCAAFTQRAHKLFDSASVLPKYNKHERELQERRNRPAVFRDLANDEPGGLVARLLRRGEEQGVVEERLEEGDEIRRGLSAEDDVAPAGARVNSKQTRREIEGSNAANEESTRVPAGLFRLGYIRSYCMDTRI